VNIAIGFGSTEEAFVRGEEQAIRAHIESRFAALKLSYFTDAFVEEIRSWIDDRAKELRDRSAAFKTAAEYPSRYSHYYATVLDDASHLVVILKLMHTNRRHGLSPDGWACMSEQQVFVFEALDIADATERGQ
jgi:hypothetical protein